MKRAVITGATGFIGQALARDLASRGVDVYAVLRPTDDDRFADVPKIKTHRIDLSDTERWQDFMDTVLPDVLYHLAWHGVSSEWKNDYGVQLQNIPVCFSVLQGAVGRCGKVVMPGSTSEYAYSGSKIDGQSAPAPGDAYAATKAALQTLCRQFAREKQLPLCWLLIGSVYGPGRCDNHLIAYTIRSLLGGKQTAFTPLEQLWDYLYVDDLTEAMYLVGNFGKPDTVYPVGSGSVRPLREYVEIIRQEIAPESPLGIGQLPYKNGHCPDQNLPDTTALLRDTGFRARVDFTDGIRKTIAYIKQSEESAWKK